MRCYEKVDLMNSRERFLAAVKLQPYDRPPVWLMRQAGRYLPEYRELREKYSFLELIRRPELAVEVSLQPWERFGMDAVILFSDILIPVAAMGPRLSFEEGVGPRFDRRIEGMIDVETLTRPRIRTSLSFTLEALEQLRHKISDEVALIGFIGGPWTLACYLSEGGSGGFSRATSMAHEGSAALNKLLGLLTDVLVDYSVSQIRAGADVIQIFDTWGGLLKPALYADIALPHIKTICKAVQEVGGAVILFIRESEKLLGIMAESGANVVSLGPGTNLTQAWHALGKNVATQGNIDPEVLLGSPAAVVSATKKLLDEIRGRNGHIVNLGHGVLPNTRPDCVKALVDTVTQFNKS